MAQMMTMGDALMSAINGVADSLTAPTRGALSENYANQSYQMTVAIERFRAYCASAGMSADMTSTAIAKGIEGIKRANPLTESPIEKLLLPWLVFQDYGPFLAFPACVHIPKDEAQVPKGGIVIVPQFAFARFRVDFAIIAKSGPHSKIVAVECDGTDFHDVNRDNYRDRYLASWGIPTVRCYGSNIHKSPSHEAERVARVVMEWNETVDGGSDG